MTYSGNTKEKLSETSRKYVLSVAYWRFFVNALLVLCDMTAFIIASAIVYVVRNAGDLYSTRFHFYLALWVYTLVGSLIWIYCLHSVGVYHRHVMGDGYQLNAFLVKRCDFRGSDGLRAEFHSQRVRTVGDHRFGASVCVTGYHCRTSHHPSVRAVQP